MKSEAQVENIKVSIDFFKDAQNVWVFLDLVDGRGRNDVRRKRKGRYVFHRVRIISFLKHIFAVY